jgi:hypothetical protein
MDARLKSYLWKSPTVRRAFRREVLSLLAWLAGFAGIVLAFHYFTGRPMPQAVWEIAGGVIAIVLMWWISVRKTVRSVIQEQLHDGGQDDTS